MELNDAELEAEYRYRYHERLGILGVVPAAGSQVTPKATPEQVVIAKDEADAWKEWEIFYGAESRINAGGSTRSSVKR